MVKSDLPKDKLSKCIFWANILAPICHLHLQDSYRNVVFGERYLSSQSSSSWSLSKWDFCLRSCLHLSERCPSRLWWDGGRIIFYWPTTGTTNWSTRMGWGGGRIIGLTIIFIRRHQENMRNELLQFSNQSSTSRDESRIAFWSWCLMNVWVVSDYAPNLFLFSVGLFLRWWKLGSCSFGVTPQIFSRGFVCLSNRKMRATQVLPFLPLLVTCQACTLHITIENIMTKWWNVCSAGQVDQSTGPCSDQKLQNLIFFHRCGTPRAKIGRPTIMRYWRIFYLNS